MNIEREYIDLMYAEIDGESSVDGQQKLDAYLAENADARDLRDDLAGLCGQLNTVEQLAPPTNLRHSVMDKIQPRKAPESDEKPALRDIFATLFGVATIRYAAAFAAGAVLTYTVISSDQISNQYFDDVTSLVGTMTQPEPLSDLTAEDGLRLTLNEVAGTVTLNRSGPILMIEFDLSSQDPVEIVAGFADPDIWFNGFAQLESSGTQISAETGQVTLRMEGQGRYAVYLYNTSPNGANVELQFYSAGILIHEDKLIFGEEN